MQLWVLNACSKHWLKYWKQYHCCSVDFSCCHRHLPSQGQVMLCLQIQSFQQHCLLFYLKFLLGLKQNKIWLIRYIKAIRAVSLPYLLFRAHSNLVQLCQMLVKLQSLQLRFLRLPCLKLLFLRLLGLYYSHLVVCQGLKHDLHLPMEGERDYTSIIKKCLPFAWFLFCISYVLRLRIKF